eukprot:EC798027.1.p1 GENE.EC798027.1~~EC798027.1.p1  ORF type:complete len:122 (+),score=33.56 EC798027.1:124-489(+)
MYWKKAIADIEALEEFVDDDSRSSDVSVVNRITANKIDETGTFKDSSGKFSDWELANAASGHVKFTHRLTGQCIGWVKAKNAKGQSWETMKKLREDIEEHIALLRELASKQLAIGDEPDKE